MNAMYASLSSTDSIELGPVPYEEECAQVGSENYETRAKEECRRYKRQLEHFFKDYEWAFENEDGEEIQAVGIPEGAGFSIKGFKHDFGRYYEVVVKYETTDEKANGFAIIVENNLPAKWEDVPEKEKAGPILTAEWRGEDVGLPDIDCYVVCPYCKQERMMETDAECLCTCEGCNKTYKVEPLL